MITFTNKGDFSKTTKYFKDLTNLDFRTTLESYGRAGVSALARNTPEDSGVTADSWDFVITTKRDSFTITWTNSNVTRNGVPIVILLQYGHATRGGSYITGRDFINPTIRPIFDQLVESLWKEVTRL